MSSIVDTEQAILDFANKAIYFMKNENKNQNSLTELLDLYNDLICDILYNDTRTEHLKEFMFSVVYRLIYFINDIANASTSKSISTSNANYKLTYNLIYELTCIYDDFYRPLLKQLAEKAFRDIININLKTRPLDCWNEITPFLHTLYTADRCQVDDDEFYNNVIELIVNRLQIDDIKIRLDMQPSTLSFWLPKEKSKMFGYLTHSISYTLFSGWIETAESIKNKNPDSLDRAKTKCLTYYRKQISNLREKLDLETLMTLRTNYENEDQNANANRSLLSTALVSTFEAVQSIIYESNQNKNKYNSYAYLLSDLCTEKFIRVREEIAEQWESILYGDMPGLITAQVQEEQNDEVEQVEQEDEEDAEQEEEQVEEQAEQEEEQVEQVDPEPVVNNHKNSGWFSWLF